MTTQPPTPRAGEARRPAPLPRMSAAERRGRILLALALALLFLAVFASTLADRILWPGIAIAVGIGLAGGTLFVAGKRGR